MIAQIILCIVGILLGLLTLLFSLINRNYRVSKIQVKENEILITGSKKNFKLFLIVGIVSSAGLIALLVLSLIKVNSG